jgi:hypothetical protein
LPVSSSTISEKQFRLLHEIPQIFRSEAFNNRRHEIVRALLPLSMAALPFFVGVMIILRRLSRSISRWI